MEGGMVIEWGVRWCSYVVHAGPVNRCPLGRAPVLLALFPPAPQCGCRLRP